MNERWLIAEREDGYVYAVCKAECNADDVADALQKLYPACKIRTTHTTVMPGSSNANIAQHDFD